MTYLLRIMAIAFVCLSMAHANCYNAYVDELHNNFVRDVHFRVSTLGLYIPEATQVLAIAKMAGAQVSNPDTKGYTNDKRLNRMASRFYFSILKDLEKSRFKDQYNRDDLYHFVKTGFESGAFCPVGEEPFTTFEVRQYIYQFIE